MNISLLEELKKIYEINGIKISSILINSEEQLKIKYPDSKNDINAIILTYKEGITNSMINYKNEYITFVDLNNWISNVQLNVGLDFENAARGIMYWSWILSIPLDMVEILEQYKNYSQLKNYTDAIKYCKIIYEYSFENDFYSLLDLCTYYLNNHEFEKTLNYSLKAFNINSNNDVINFCLGNSYFELKQYANSIYHFEKIWNDSKYKDNVLFFLALSCWYVKDNSKALYYAKINLEKDSENVIMYCLIGGILIDENNFNEARKYIEKGLEIERTNETLLNLLRELYLKENK